MSATMSILGALLATFGLGYLAGIVSESRETRYWRTRADHWCGRAVKAEASQARQGARYTLAEMAALVERPVPGGSTREAR